MTMHVLVAGAGGFIGGHLVRELLDTGHTVRAADIKVIDDWWQVHPEATNTSCRDLRNDNDAEQIVAGMDRVYNLAADMGGMGFIETHRADCMVSVLINTNLIRAAAKYGVERYFYASSACVYHHDVQTNSEVVALREEDAYHNGGAMPENGYGWEKLFSERMCQHFMEEKGLECRVARFHNVYGPQGSWEGGREKAPASMCRKVAEAVRDGTTTIDVWGNGTNTRSFMYIDDCVEGICRLMNSNVREPINLGSNELVSIDQLRLAVERIGGVKLTPVYDLSIPQGVAGRNSDNTKIKELLHWEPTTPLVIGLSPTYAWIQDQVTSSVDGEV